MKRPLFTGLAALAAITFLAPVSTAQSNTISGLDVILGQLDGLDDLGRTGTFPNGRSGFAMSTTSCNPGSVEASWEAAMDPDHPFICFIMTRESGGRMVQISNYSRVKHGFFALSSNQCGLGCAGTSGDALGLGCSDTYGIGTNGGRNNLGPAEEIDPWLGEWNPTGSLFDGTPVDGQRSYFGSEPNGVIGRVEVEDSDLDVAGANFYYYSQYIVEHEAEANRNNNQGWHPATISWNGSGYSVGSSFGTPNYGSVLDAWTGATVNSNTNGSSDGRYYVASLTTPAGPNTHYEYAVHNRDNARAMDSFRVPIAPGTVITNFGFHDIDQNAGNDWTASVIGNEVVFSTTTNPLMWNSIFNFWFDADASPVNSSIALDQHFGGGGAATVTVTGAVPGGGVIDPCAQSDDGLEENDSCAAATTVTSGFNGGLFVHKTDEDWYRVSTNNGDTLTMTAFFNDSVGDLDIELFDACGNPFIQNSATATDNEQVSVTNNTGGAQDYFLRVFVFATAADDCNNYNLDVDVQGTPPPGCGTPDALEPNDSCGAAIAVGSGTVNNLTVQDVMDDWYEISLTPGQTLDFNISFSNAMADLDLELFLACGQSVIDQSVSTSDFESVGLTNNSVSTQDYFVRVFVWNDNAPCNTYNMTVDITGGMPTGCNGADALEPNDSCAAALAQGIGTVNNLTVQDNNDDFYEFTLTAGQTLDFDIAFTNATADLDLELFDACGNAFILNAETVTDDESLSWTNNTGSTQNYVARVFVWNDNAPCNDYSMTVDITGGMVDPCATQLADAFEENDTCGAAVTMGTSFNAALTIHKTDEDWYEVVVAAGATIDVDLFFLNATADVDCFLFDACGGTLLVQGFSGDDDESISWTNATGSSITTKLQVNVFGGSTGDCNDYDMDIDVQGGVPTNLIPSCFGDGSGTNCPCGNNSTAGHPGGCGNSVGNGLVLLASGTPSVSNDTLGFTTSSGVPASLAVLVSGDNLLGMGNGILGMPPTDGLRCVGQNFLRHGNRQIQANGAPTQPWGEGGFPAAGLINQGAFTAGQTRHFAVVYRDFEAQVCMTGLNTSNAITVTVLP